MRGKKKDSEFLSKFITECVQSDKDSPDAIVAEAKARIARIDQQIQEVEKQKIVRSKLLDVICTFEQPAKTSPAEEIKALSFFKIQHPAICKSICDRLKQGNILIESIFNEFSPKQDVIFCIKQLLELKIMSKAGNCILRGDLFDEYCQFVFENERE